MVHLQAAGMPRVRRCEDVQRPGGCGIPELLNRPARANEHTQATGQSGESSRAGEQYSEQSSRELEEARGRQGSAGLIWWGQQERQEAWQMAVQDFHLPSCPHNFLRTVYTEDGLFLGGLAPCSPLSSSLAEEARGLNLSQLC